MALFLTLFLWCVSCPCAASTVTESAVVVSLGGGPLGAPSTSEAGLVTGVGASVGLGSGQQALLVIVVLVAAGVFARVVVAVVFLIVNKRVQLLLLQQRECKVPWLKVVVIKVVVLLVMLYLLTLVLLVVYFVVVLSPLCSQRLFLYEHSRLVLLLVKLILEYLVVSTLL